MTKITIFNKVITQDKNVADKMELLINAVRRADGGRCTELQPNGKWFENALKSARQMNYWLLERFPKDLNF